MQTKPFEISALSIHSVVKLNFTRLSVCFYNTPLKCRKMTSLKVIDVSGALYHVASNRNANYVLLVYLFVYFLRVNSWCLRLTAACDCGTPWTFLLTFVFVQLVCVLSLSKK